LSAIFDLTRNELSKLFHLHDVIAKFQEVGTCTAELLMIKQLFFIVF